VRLFSLLDQGPEAWKVTLQYEFKDVGRSEPLEDCRLFNIQIVFDAEHEPRPVPPSQEHHNKVNF
jgi:hypothetical protein